MNKNQKQAKAKTADAETLTDILRRVLKETGPDGKSNAEAVVDALIRSAKRGNREAISAVLSRSGMRARVVICDD